MNNNIQNLMKQAQRIQSQVSKMQEELADRTVEASAGGGMVVAVANGRQEIVSIAIDPQVVDADDVEMLEDLVVAAVSEALARAGEMAAEEMKKVTGGMSLPGLF